MNLNIEKKLEEFLAFVRAVRSIFCGGANPHQQNRGGRVGTGIDIAERVEENLRAYWSIKAPTYAGRCHDAVYCSVMETILEQLCLLRINPKNKLRILSVGAGPGVYETFLSWALQHAEVNAKIHSTDYCQEMIDFQKNLLESHERTSLLSLDVDRIKPWLDDITDLSRLEGRADILLCLDVIKWVNDWKLAAQQMATAMNIAGHRTLIMSFPPNSVGIGSDYTGSIIRDIDRRELLDEMWKHGFRPRFLREVRPNTGNKGGDRSVGHHMFVFKFSPSPLTGSWLDMGSTRKEAKMATLKSAVNWPVLQTKGGFPLLLVEDTQYRMLTPVEA